MDGIGPSQLQIDSLVERIQASRQGGVDEQGRSIEPIREVILALSTTMDGDTTNFYIFRKLAEFADLRITTLARGVAVGDELEYADGITLGKAIQNRTLFTDSFGRK